MVKSGTNQQIGYLLRSYPRLSQTFILNEILALERSGLSLQIYALTDPREPVVQPQVAQVRAPVHYLDAPVTPGRVAGQHTRALLRRPLGYLRALGYTLVKKAADQGYTSGGRWESFHQAVLLANLIQASPGGPAIGHLHAHFAHNPTFIAQLVHRLTGVPFSFTAHARDLFQVPRKMLAEHIREARFVVTCCRNNLRYLRTVAPAGRSKYRVIYHGVNLQAFRPPAVREACPDAPLILSVGRLVEKKGFFDLLAALEYVREVGLDFECLIFGEGPLYADLQAWIEAHGLARQVQLRGSTSQEQLAAISQRAALFALTPTVTEDGDRDGIPNVLVEAMAAGLPVVSTATAGIPELVTPGVDGLLYPPHDVAGLAAGIAGLLRDPERRLQLGRAARRKVLASFDEAQAACQLVGLFEAARAPAPRRRSLPVFRPARSIGRRWRRTQA